MVVAAVFNPGSGTYAGVATKATASIAKIVTLGPVSSGCCRQPLVALCPNTIPNRSFAYSIGTQFASHVLINCTICLLRRFVHGTTTSKNF